MNVQPIWHADVFFDEDNKGNQAAVVVLEEELESAVMQTIASEQGLPATAFIWPLSAKLYAIRWFSPTQSIKLCGHGTLAAANVLNQIHNLEKIDFATEDHILLSCTIEEKHSSIILPLITLEQVSVEPVFLSTLNINIQKQYQTAYEQGYVVLELESLETVKNLKPDFNALAETTQRAIIVTAHTNEQIGFRYFAPQYGNNEDQATGSALCVLADFYNKEYTMQSLDALQLSEHGGKMQSTLLDNGVEVFGKVRTINAA